MWGREWDIWLCECVICVSLSYTKIIVIWCGMCVCVCVCVFCPCDTFSEISMVNTHTGAPSLNPGVSSTAVKVAVESACNNNIF